MWKDYLYLNKKERAAFLAFTILIVAVQLGIWTSGKWLPVLARSMKSDESLKIDSLQTIMETGFENGFGNPGGSRSGYKKRSVTKVKLRTFDPNTADSATFVSLGIRPYVAKNILKYRSKGGKFRKPEDFSRIYGLEKSTFESLLPYILVETGEKTVENPENGFNQIKANNKIDSAIRIETGKSNYGQTEKQEKNITIVSGSSKNSKDGVEIVTSTAGFELNSADTSSLQLLKGVGSVTASMIIRYGNQLGGYYDVSQLSEIKGLYPNVLANLQKSMTVNATLIRKININKASLERLKAHPYLDFYQAKAIVGLRTARKGIKDIKELAEFKEFSPEDLEKLKWYLEF